MAGLAQKPEHAAWARPFLGSDLRAAATPWILAAPIEGLSDPTSPVSDRWVSHGASSHPLSARVG